MREEDLLVGRFPFWRQARENPATLTEVTVGVMREAFEACASGTFTPKVLYMRVGIADRKYYLGEVRRLSEALHYKSRMQRAGVPLKTQDKILARWRSAFCYALHKEMAGLIADLKRRP